MLKLFRKNVKGFTLVELMVVIVILGILTSLAIPMYEKTQENARTKACQANQRILEGAWQQYIANEGLVLDQFLDQDGTIKGNNIYEHVKDFIREMPKCPGAKDAPAGEYVLDPKDGKIDCTLHDYYGGEPTTSSPAASGGR